MSPLSGRDFYMPSVRENLFFRADEDFDRERVRPDKLDTLCSNVFIEDGGFMMSS